jgi:hypothetical protein
MALSNSYQDVIVHEMAHAYEAQKMIKGQIKEFEKISWKNNQPKTETGFVREYSTHSPKEDWATSVELYFKDPNALKKISLEKYNFIRNLFGVRYRGGSIKSASYHTPTSWRFIYV